MNFALHFSVFLLFSHCMSACIVRPTKVKAPNIAEAQEQAEVYYDLWDSDFETVLSKLPNTGEAEKKPYSGYWYPEKSGGTAAGFDSAIRKYDRAFSGGGTPAVNWEMRYHNDRVRNWVGHCNGFASASQLLLEPQTSVVRNSVTFLPTDIKTLLAEIHQHANVKFLGGRRCYDVKISDASVVGGGVYCPQGFRPYTVYYASGVEHLRCIANKPNRLASEVLSDCEDVNAGTFHLAVSNWIGKKRHTIIMDKESYDQVWNYPTYAYHLAGESRYISKEEALAMTRVHSSTGQYPFNRMATKFYYVKMHLFYADVYEDGERLNEFVQGKETYTYILELNDKGSIIGGEWTAQSYDTHPDFLWVALEPKQTPTEAQLHTQLGVTNPQAVYQYLRDKSNPLLKVEEVLGMWAESIGKPINYRPDFFSKLQGSLWGDYPLFSLMLDGDASGVVFLGKKVHLDVILTEELGSRELGISLNSSKLASASSYPSEVNYLVEPQEGINTLSIQFGSESHKVRFLGIPNE